MRIYRIVAACCLTILVNWAAPLVTQAQDAGVVTDCRRYDASGGLQAALASAKPVHFACSGTLIVPEIVISADTSLDATGQSVILSGNNANRIFCINSGGTLTLSHL